MTFFAMVHYLGYSRIVKKLHISDRSRKWLTGLLIFNFLAIGGYVAARYALNIPNLLYLLLSLSIGVGFVLLISLIFYELLHLFQRIAPFDQEKRDFFKRTSDLGFLSLGSAYMGAAVYGGNKQPVVEYVTIDQQRFEGKSYRIVQLSDMHIGGLIEKEFVRHCVEMTNALKPDLVAITGDLTDMQIEEIAGAVDELAGLKSRYGTYYIPGNHEYFHGLEPTLAYLETLGIHVLGNRAMPVADFWVAGVYDVFGYRYGNYMPDIRKATQNIPENADVLLLAHQPRFIEDLDGFRPALMLSGHTHGGQIWPFGYLVELVQPYLKGLHLIGENAHIYVNSGVGFWGPPMRLGTQAEITCIDWS
jgi:predicted MPP superfamily phosphohydrolase